MATSDAPEGDEFRIPCPNCGTVWSTTRLPAECPTCAVIVRVSARMPDGKVKS